MSFYYRHQGVRCQTVFCTKFCTSLAHKNAIMHGFDNLGVLGEFGGVGLVI